jgi:hypothetical protein
MSQSTEHAPNPETTIKLCTSNGGEINDPISCSLSSANLDDDPAYKCISYAWGEAGDNEPINVNGEDVLVPSNLVAALRALRKKGITSKLWADTLCIDQEKLSEKGKHVAMMGRIYSTAEEVVVWLGEVPGATSDEDDRDNEFDTSDIMEKLAKDSHFHDLPFMGPCRSRQCPADLGEHGDNVRPWSKALEALMAWFEAVWFERMWTVQEIVLAEKASLMPGNVSLDWATVEHAWCNLARHLRGCCSECLYGLPGTDSNHIYEMACHIIDLSLARKKLDQGQHLVEHLLQFSGKKSTIDLDQIYGCLGLQSGAKPTPVYPDYHITLPELLRRFAGDIIRTQGWLMPLCLGLRHKLPDLPSWVPNRSNQGSNPGIYRIIRYVWSFSYGAAKDLAGPAQISNDNRLLQVDGIQLDKIAWVSSVHELTSKFSDHLDTLDEWSIAVDLESGARNPYVGGGDLESAFWRTMFADRYFLEDQGSRSSTAENVHYLQDFVQQCRSDIQQSGPNPLIGPQRYFHVPPHRGG